MSTVDQLREYQKRATIFSLKKQYSYQALDMGLGKTAIALTWAANILLKNKDVPGVLVIAPLRTIDTTWPDEIAKWRPELRYTILHGRDKDFNLKRRVDIYLMNYEGIQWLFDALKRLFKTTGRLPFRAVILDEGSMVKSHRTKRFKILRKLRQIFPKYRLILSGTPAPNSLLDLWAQYYFLDGGARLGSSFTAYQKMHFVQVDRMGFVWKIRSEADRIAIYEKIKDITYRLDAKDHIKLPDRIDNIIKVKLPDKVRKQYDKLEKDFFLKLEEAEVEAFNAASLSMKLRQFLQGAVYIDEQKNYEIFHKEKVKALKELVESSAGQPILCAIQFRFELDLISKVFPNTPVIAGGTHAKNATKYIREWNKGNLSLLLCHPASISHGVNLQTGGHIVLWYGLTWSLEQYLQFNARLHRHGQLNNVIVHHLVVEKSIDERVMKAIKHKFKSQNELLEYIKGEK